MESQNARKGYKRLKELPEENLRRLQLAKGKPRRLSIEKKINTVFLNTNGG